MQVKQAVGGEDECPGDDDSDSPPIRQPVSIDDRRAEIQELETIAPAASDAVI